MKPLEAPARLLLVDDEGHILRALQRALRQALGAQARIEGHTSGAAALERAAQQPFDLVLCDLRMPVMPGPEVLRHMRELQPDCVRLILTGTADFATAQQAMNELGVFRYLTKPWQVDELVGHCRDAIHHAQARRHERDQALAWAAAQGQATPQELERRRLEAMEPGLTRVEWDDDGAYVLTR